MRKTRGKSGQELLKYLLEMFLKGHLKESRANFWRVTRNNPGKISERNSEDDYSQQAWIELRGKVWKHLRKKSREEFLEKY